MVTVGDGGGLHITHIGSSLISSLTINFFITNILICLNASSNLLSIQKFYANNNCYIIFTVVCFIIKNLQT